MSIHLKSYPGWVVFSVAANGLLLLVVTSQLLRQHQWSMHYSASEKAATIGLYYPMPDLVPELGPRHHLNYPQWVNLLRREAEAIASQQPENLSILIGDSLSLWFPIELLPTNKTWLNQGISGETSAGLLNRLYILDRTEPKVIFVMIGINDMIGGVGDRTILTNQKLIVRYLKRVHPQAQIVLQSILPHSAESVTWEGRDRLLSIPNSRIQALNERSRMMAEREGVFYIDLYPLFADANGNLKNELSTDGLHLNANGYLVWRDALQVVNQVVLQKAAFQ